MTADVFKLTQESFTITHLTVIKHIASTAQHYFNFPPQVFLIVSILKPKEKELNKEANTLLQ